MARGCAASRGGRRACGTVKCWRRRRSWIPTFADIATSASSATRRTASARSTRTRGGLSTRENARQAEPLGPPSALSPRGSRGGSLSRPVADAVAVQRSRRGRGGGRLSLSLSEGSLSLSLSLSLSRSLSPQEEEAYEPPWAVGTLLWAKVRGFPTWPAAVEVGGPSCCLLLSSNAHAFVRFFATKDAAWVAAADAAPFADRRDELVGANVLKKTSKGTLRAKYKQACDEIVAAAANAPAVAAPRAGGGADAGAEGGGGERRRRPRRRQRPSGAAKPRRRASSCTRRAG